jgi:hypothetical protein
MPLWIAASSNGGFNYVVRSWEIWFTSSEANYWPTGGL